MEGHPLARFFGSQDLAGMMREGEIDNTVQTPQFGCPEVRVALALLGSGTLSDALAQRVFVHLARCLQCRAELALSVHAMAALFWQNGELIDFQELPKIGVTNRQPAVNS